MRNAQEHVSKNKKGAMHFLELIRYRLCCPPKHMILGPGLSLCCNTCQKILIPNLYEFVNDPSSDDFFYSGLLAQALSEWIECDNVPMSFPLSHVEGILDTVVRGQPLHRVRKSIRLLRAINGPFTKDQATTRSDLDEMNTFLTDFLNIISENPTSESEDERIALDALMKNMHDLVASRNGVNPFGSYFDVLVPYVKTCGYWEDLETGGEDPNPASELHAQLVRSGLIRGRLSRYAVPFDVIHVMVCCYACSSDMDVVGNWAIDFMARVCRGQFDWKLYVDSPFVIRMMKLIHSQFTCRRNTQFYFRVVRPIQRGESIDHYSTLWEPYHEMRAILKSRYSVPGVPSSDILDMAFAHLFPAVLFPDYSDQLGFTLGFNHLLMSFDREKGTMARGAFKKAKLIHSIVRRFIRCVEDFHDDKLPRKADKLVWNLDTVRLFFASDPKFHEEIMHVVNVLVGKQED